MAESAAKTDLDQAEDFPRTPDNRGFEGEFSTIVAQKVQEVPRRYRGHFRLAMAGKSRKAAIRAMCLECVGWNATEVKLCTAPGCPLYPYRIRG